MIKCRKERKQQKGGGGKKKTSRHRKLFFCPSRRLRNDSCTHLEVLAVPSLPCQVHLAKNNSRGCDLLAAKITPVNASRVHRRAGGPLRSLTCSLRKPSQTRWTFWTFFFLLGFQMAERLSVSCSSRDHKESEENRLQCLVCTLLSQQGMPTCHP